MECQYHRLSEAIECRVCRELARVRIDVRCRGRCHRKVSCHVKIRVRDCDAVCRCQISSNECLDFVTDGHDRPDELWVRDVQLVCNCIVERSMECGGIVGCLFQLKAIEGVVYIPGVCKPEREEIKYYGLGAEFIIESSHRYAHIIIRGIKINYKIGRTAPVRYDGPYI